MAKLIIHQEKITDNQELVKICPFGAMEEKDGKLSINAACKMCRLCVKKGPEGAVEYVEDTARPSVNKEEWKGIAVYVDHVDGKIHPVTLELLGKARELAQVTGHPVYAVFMGNHISEKSHELLHYGADKVFIYDEPELERFKIEPYTAVFEDFIQNVKPSSILVGATTVGRQLAPRVAARMKTGLTADCTILEMNEDTDLSQIRPAFGGNIMADIVTQFTRPQFATVRPGVMQKAEKDHRIVTEYITEKIEKTRKEIEVISSKAEAVEKGIADEKILVVAGRGVKKKEDLDMLRELAELLGGTLASSRALVEKGWMLPKEQIGLSGNTVSPDYMITCGVSGTVQFMAGMKHTKNIIAINEDPKARIFEIAHYPIVGDLYEIVPELIRIVKERR